MLTLKEMAVDISMRNTREGTPLEKRVFTSLGEEVSAISFGNGIEMGIGFRYLMSKEDYHCSEAVFDYTPHIKGNKE